MDMDFAYERNAMQEAVAERLRRLTGDDFNILLQRLHIFQSERKNDVFNLTFTLIPRLIKKTDVSPDTVPLLKIHAGFCLSGWSAERLARVWWLLQLPADNKNRYVKQIEGLFKMAEMNEQIALYSSLPLLAYAEAFRERATEGLRSNIKTVFEAIALNNPYPAAYLDEQPWNQMVLKAFFMNMPVYRIAGLDQRSNKALACMLSDYAHERWAAGRVVPPLLWRPVGKFIDEEIFEDIRKLFQSGDEKEMQAAALACASSGFEPAQLLLLGHPLLKTQVEKGTLTWDSLEE